jgi:hypothetical protein
VKRWLSVGILASFALLLVACEPQISLFPLYTNTDTLFDKQLLGEWQIWSGAELKPGQIPGKIVFSQSAVAYTYDVKIPNFNEQTGAALFTQGRLLSLGKYVFIDFGTPDGDNLPQVPYPMVDGHVFGTLSLQGDKARIDLLGDEWTKNMVKIGNMSLPFQNAPKLVLSASTTDLRRFALKHAENQDAFSEVFSLVRNK